jgi:hypothetical protein
MTIKFFTTSTLTDIQVTQSKLIKKHFPDSEHIIIDGREGWFMVWYEFLTLATDADYYIHLDEDCFVLSPDKIIETINFMKDNDYDIAGPADGGHTYRGGNPMALNAFFMIFNQKCVDDWFNRPEVIPQFKEEWKEPYPYESTNGFQYNYNMEFGSSGKPIGQIWRAGTEPYYDFFWVLKAAGRKFLYLEAILGEEFGTTNLLDDTILHAWHMRDRNSMNVVSTLHNNIPNKIRFDMLINRVNPR